MLLVAIGGFYLLYFYTMDPNKLEWAPPVLDEPTTIDITSTGYTETKLDTTKDYVIDLPDKRKVGATVIEGGHNVVIKGGYLTVPPNDGEGKETRGLYVKGATGTVHVEGVKVDGSGGGYIDGLVFGYMPEATVQLENVRVVSLHGNARFHADIIQVWEGVNRLRIDRFTGSSNYQGIFT